MRIRETVGTIRSATRSTAALRPAARRRGPATGVRGRLAALDLAVFHEVSAARLPLADATLPRLSRAADHSALWIGTAVVIGLSGPRGRRAALRGLGSLAVSSALANGPVKWFFGRRRPPLEGVPLPRRIHRQPQTTSFPSGHSASAAAFATAVAMESPAVAVPVGLAAGAIAFSRVYVGVHYPADVLAGVALGAGAALLTTRVMPRRPDVPARAAPASAWAPALPTGEGLVLVVNGGAGRPGSPPIVADLRKALPAAEIVEVGDRSLPDVLRAAARRARVLGIAGGDGSINCAADIAVAAGLPLAVVPAGTLNHFAGDLGLASWEDTVDAVKAGTAVAVDLGRFSPDPGGVFLNTASIGGYPEMVAMRERLEGRLGKWTALMIALVRVLRTEPPTDLEIDGRPRRVWLLFAGNGRYLPRGLAPTFRGRLDERLLDLRIVDASSPLSRTRLVAALFLGALGRSRVYEQRDVEQVHIRLTGTEFTRLARDGEVGDAPREFVLSAGSQQLVVYRPGG